MYLKSADIETIGGKRYLRVFMDDKYPYIVKHNGQELKCYDLLFEEPNMEDMGVLKKLAISLEKLNSYENVKTIRIANLFSNKTYENIARDKAIEIEDQENPDETILEAVEKEEKEEKDTAQEAKSFLAKVFGFSSDFEDESSNYFLELFKFVSFLDTKCKRVGDNGLLLSTSMNVLDTYKASSVFVKEEIVVEYFSFFFEYLPSKSLHAEIFS